MTNITPVVNIPAVFINGFNVSVASNTTLTVDVGTTRDSANNIDIEFEAAVTINTAVVGPNGLDIGTLGASSWYYVYAISDSTGYKVDAAILSLSATAPTQQRGYDVYKLVGVALTDGSSHFLKLYQVGNGNVRTCVWDTLPAVLTGGSATSFTAIDLSAGVPPIANTPVVLQASYTPAVATNVFSYRPTGSAATVVPGGKGSVAAVVQMLHVPALSAIASSVSKIDYLVTASDALSLSVYSFTLFL